MGFPIVIYGCESWTVKTAERRRIDVFELWCWRRLLRVPWTARRSNQPILKLDVQLCDIIILIFDSLITYGEIVETVSDFIFGAPKSLQMVTAAMKLKDAYSLEEKL